MSLQSESTSVPWPSRQTESSRCGERPGAPGTLLSAIKDPVLRYAVTKIGSRSRLSGMRARYDLCEEESWSALARKERTEAGSSVLLSGDPSLASVTSGRMTSSDRLKGCASTRLSRRLLCDGPAWACDDDADGEVLESEGRTLTIHREGPSLVALSDRAELRFRLCVLFGASMLRQCRRPWDRHTREVMVEKQQGGASDAQSCE